MAFGFTSKFVITVRLVLPNQTDGIGFTSKFVITVRLVLPNQTHGIGVAWVFFLVRQKMLSGSGGMLPPTFFKKMGA
jgi:hypothetical protein